MTNDFNYQQGPLIENKKKGVGCCGIIMLMIVVFILASCFTGKAQAQATATPTPEPTRVYSFEAELMPTVFPGHYLSVDTRVGVGEIGLAVVGSMIILIIMLYATLRIITIYLR